MFKNLILFIVINISISSEAQITFQENIISTNVNGASSIFSIDIDGDGDIDVVSASRLDNKIVWFENTDGLGNFNGERIISTNANGVNSVFAIDIDGDGDIDVLSSLSGDSTIAWYEHIDGVGTFSSEKIISSDISNLRCVIACDLDNDTDEDVLFTSYTNTVSWYENINSFGMFGTEQEINNGGVKHLFTSDIDNDGDNDVVYDSGSTRYIFWSENLGNGLFVSHIISTCFSGRNSIHLNDINNDGNIDVVYEYQAKDVIAWSENTGLNSDSAFIHEEYNLIDTNIFMNLYNYLFAIYSTDIDNDGDIDIINTICDSTIKWYQNLDGLGYFDTSKVLVYNTNSIISNICTADIDGDGDKDIITASYSSNKVAWYKNLLIDNINEINKASFSIYPNPSKNELFLEIMNCDLQNTNIEIYDVYGKIVKQFKITNSKLSTNKTSPLKIKIEDLQTGIYFIKIGSVVAKFVKI